MLGKLKNKGTDLVLKTKNLFSSSEPSATYGKDLRKVVTYKDGRKCRYPSNYHKIVESGEIIEEKDSDGKSIYKLVYGKKDKNGERPRFTLALVKEAGDKSYFTIKFPCPTKDLDETYITSFGFTTLGFPTRRNLKKYAPIFEVDTKSLQLTNSSILDKKGRNGQLLYTSHYQNLNISFFEIRDRNGNLELDKSLISVPIAFAAGLTKIAAGVLTYLPMKSGEYLISKQNPVAKLLGYLLFTLAIAVKNLVNMGATFLKLPICAFVAKKEKYGDAYFTMWKHQLKGCWKEAKNDFNVVKNCEREVEQKEKLPNFQITATWDELDAMKPGIEEDLEKQKNSNSKGASETLRSESKNIDGEVVKKLEAAVSKEQIKALHGELPQTSTNHIDQLQNRRNSQTENGTRSA